MSGPAPAPWERQEGESAKAFAAFSVYRDLGPARSIRHVSDTVSTQERWLREWSRKNQWRARAALWDDENDRVAREAGWDALREQKRKHLAVAEGMLDLVQQWLKNRTHEDIEKASEVARLADVAVKVARLTSGQPTDRGESKVTVRDELPELQDLLADPEIQALLGGNGTNGNGRNGNGSRLRG